MDKGPITTADYDGEVVIGMRWRRAYRVIIGNPYLGQPTVSIDEEEITNIEDRVSSIQTGTLTVPVDPDALIDLIDPTTGEPIPGAQVTHGQVYVALYSLYRALAAARDAADAIAAKEAADRAATLAGVPVTP